ncbi:MAG: TolC family protein, partial [Desulfarculus sp.]|nr:TolC family protein [Desulfarculus sp.]
QPALAVAEVEGQVLTPVEVTPILRGRGTQHVMAGWLYYDERVWAGYLGDGYYAVFDLKDKGSPESKAKGYVKASALRKLTEEERAAMAAPAGVAAAKPTAPAPAPAAVAPAPAPAAKAPEPAAKPAAPAPAPAAKAPEPAVKPASATPAPTPAPAATAPAPAAKAPEPAAKPAQAAPGQPLPMGVPVTMGKPPLPRPLTLKAAIAYALDNNLDAAVARQEQVVQEEMRTSAKWSLLPSLILESENSWKDREVATSSRSLKTGKQSLEPSISSDQTVNRQTAIMSWDLLNLAVNVNRWMQADARVKASGEHLRRIKQDLVLDITRSYMQTAVAESSAKNTRGIMDKLKNRTKLVKRQVQERTVPEVAGLEAEAHFINLIMRFKQHERRAETHRAELARLLGTDRVDDIEIPPLAVESPLHKEPAPKIETLWREAQNLRPELMALDLDKEISLRDVTNSMARLLPAPTIFARFDHDNNSYLSESEWFTLGLKISWDLLGIPRNLAERSAAQARVLMVDRRKEAMVTAVFTQVRLATIEQAESMDDIELLRDLNESRSRLLTAMEGQVKQGKSHEGDLLDAEQKYLVANHEFINSYGRLVTSRARLNNSVGRDWKAK